MINIMFNSLNNIIQLLNEQDEFSFENCVISIPKPELNLLFKCELEIKIKSDFGSSSSMC